ncbi:MAG TPA: ABC transporter ATP-binding protein, partial [Burkholderiaceae bacterium]
MTSPDLRASDPPDPTSESAAVSVTTLYRSMWLYAAGARGLLLVSSAMLAGSQLVKLLVPWFTAQAINTLQLGGSAAAGDCLPWIGGIVAVYVACWALHGPGRVIERTVSLRVRRALADRLYVRLTEAPLAWHAAQHPAELAHRMSQATQALTNFTQSQFIYLQNAVNLAGPLLALWFLSHLVGAAATLGMAAVIVTIVSFDRALMRLAQAENSAEREYTGSLLDGLSNITTVLALRLQPTTRRLLARRLDQAVEPVKRSIRLNEWKWCAVDLLGVLVSWGVVILFAWETRGNSTVLLGGIFMAFQYAQQAWSVIGSMAANLQNFARMRTDFSSAGPIWDAPCAEVPTPHPHAAPRPAARWHHIDLCALSYRHPSPAGRRAADQSPAGLRELSLRLNAGERIALVGPSGCGKSTLLRVLAGLCPPSGGHIEIDGVARVGHQDLRHGATLIPQEAQMFAGTLRENIGFDLGHTDAAILRAARVAALEEMVAELPLGLGAPVTQGGSNLSGGQRQRVSL